MEWPTQSENETKCSESFKENKLFHGEINNDKLSNSLWCIKIIDEINCKICDTWTKNHYLYKITLFRTALFALK